MALDFNALKAQLASLQKKGPDAIWKPEEGDTTIRIVPLQGSPDNPFQQLFFHYGLGGKTYLSPRSFGETDPIADFSDALCAAGGMSKQEYKDAKKFSPQMRTYVPIVIRGKEAEGVKFWAFGKTIFEELLKVMTDEDYGDITDIKNGYDIKVTFTPQEKSSTDFAQTNILIKPKPVPLTTDAELRKKLLEQQPILMDCFKKWTSEELDEVFQKLMNPSSVPTSPKPTTEWAEEDTSTNVVTPTKLTADVEKEFEDIFNN